MRAFPWLFALAFALLAVLTPALAGPAWYPPAGGSSAPTASQLPGASVLSPAALAADQNDYAPGTLSAFTVVRLDPDAHVSITGLSGGSAGYRTQLCNVDTAFRVHVANQSASSSAANRITAQDAAGLAIQPGACLDLVYDGSSSLWRAPVSSPEVSLVLAADFVESANTVTDVTGMACPTVSGATYVVSVVGDFDTAATTTGLQWTIFSTGAAGSFWAVATSGATLSTNRMEAITAGTLAAGTAAAATAGNPFWGSAAVTSVGNPIVLRARSEVGASAITLKAGRVVMTCRRVS